jgi:hypothetical protein
MGKSASFWAQHPNHLAPKQAIWLHIRSLLPDMLNEAACHVLVAL